MDSATIAAAVLKLGNAAPSGKQRLVVARLARNARNDIFPPIDGVQGPAINRTPSPRVTA
jgi:hypothetical protein